jgi:hypothetical protein
MLKMFYLVFIFALVSCKENSSELSESTVPSIASASPEVIDFPEFVAGHYNHEEKYWESSDEHYKTTPMSHPEFSDLCRSDEQGACRSGLGVVDNKGKIIVKPIYESISFHLFHKGLFLVGLNSKEGLINKQGDEIVPPQFDFIREDGSRFDDGLLAVKKDELCGYIDLTGKDIIPVQYTSVDIAGEGMIAVMNEPQKWGYINYQNELIIPMQFWSPTPFVNGKATRLQKDDGEFTVYKDGRIEQTTKW